jgi:hypothetical protein
LLILTFLESLSTSGVRDKLLHLPWGVGGGKVMYKEGDMSMVMEKMPRGFWSYTAGKGSAAAEEREARREKVFQGLRETLPGVLGFAVVMLLTLLMLLMMFAEFRGFYLDQVSNLFRVR